MKYILYILIFGLAILNTACNDSEQTAEIIQESSFSNDDRIKPYTENPRYWQYKGEPVLLLGGSDQDNPFNHPNIMPEGLESQLDLLASVGGNYIRNTMTSRDRVVLDNPYFNDDNVYAFYSDPETGLYDLERFNDEYWDRFRNFLDLTAERDIIVQIEIWDRVDYARDHTDYPAEGWSAQPFNPKNNINYTSEESGLPEVIDTHPGQRENPFFRTTPQQEDNPLVLNYQHRFTDKLLSITLEYGHILYCISNETNESEIWSGYWASYIHKTAGDADTEVEITEMWDAHDLNHEMHRYTYENPELYSYWDISQNNHQVEQTHWNNMQTARELLADSPRPMNSIKIYGGWRHGGNVTEGTHKLWRNILGGLATSRFHRPVEPGMVGIGLNELAQTHLQSARMFADAFDVFAAEPDNGLLSFRRVNEAYCMATRGKQYAVYFTDGGSIELDLSEGNGDQFTLSWLDIEESRWLDDSKMVIASGSEQIETPGEGQWVAVLIRND